MHPKQASPYENKPLLLLVDELITTLVADCELQAIIIRQADLFKIHSGLKALIVHLVQLNKVKEIYSLFIPIFNNICSRLEAHYHFLCATPIPAQAQALATEDIVYIREVFENLIQNLKVFTEYHRTQAMPALLKDPRSAAHFDSDDLAYYLKNALQRDPDHIETPKDWNRGDTAFVNGISYQTHKTVHQLQHSGTLEIKKFCEAQGLNTQQASLVCTHVNQQAIGILLTKLWIPINNYLSEKGFVREWVLMPNYGEGGIEYHIFTLPNNTFCIETRAILHLKNPEGSNIPITQICIRVSITPHVWQQKILDGYGEYWLPNDLQTKVGLDFAIIYPGHDLDNFNNLIRAVLKPSENHVATIKEKKLAELEAPSFLLPCTYAVFNKMLLIKKAIEAYRTAPCWKKVESICEHLGNINIHLSRILKTPDKADALVFARDFLQENVRQLSIRLRGRPVNLDPPQHHNAFSSILKMLQFISKEIVGICYKFVADETSAQSYASYIEFLEDFVQNVFAGGIISHPDEDSLVLDWSRGNMAYVNNQSFLKYKRNFLMEKPVTKNDIKRFCVEHYLNPLQADLICSLATQSHLGETIGYLLRIFNTAIIAHGYLAAIDSDDISIKTLAISNSAGLLKMTWSANLQIICPSKNTTHKLSFVSVTFLLDPGCIESPAAATVKAKIKLNYVWLPAARSEEMRQLYQQFKTMFNPCKRLFAEIEELPAIPIELRIS
jgi:hypothetical protein